MFGERTFLTPITELILDDFDLTEEEVMEVAIFNNAVSPARNALSEELSNVNGLIVSGYLVKSFDFPQIIFLAGSIGSLLSGAEVIERVLNHFLESEEHVRLEVRTKKGGTLKLRTNNMEEARELLSQAARLVALPHGRVVKSKLKEKMRSESIQDEC